MKKFGLYKLNRGKYERDLDLNYDDEAEAEKKALELNDGVLDHIAIMSGWRVLRNLNWAEEFFVKWTGSRLVKWGNSFSLNEGENGLIITRHVTDVFNSFYFALGHYKIGGFFRFILWPDQEGRFGLPKMKFSLGR